MPAVAVLLVGRQASQQSQSPNPTANVDAATPVPITQKGAPEQAESPPVPSASRQDEAFKKSYDFANDVTKQLLTLATGVVALTVTFQKEVGAPPELKWVIVLAWLIFLVSIVCGLLTLMALTGSLRDVAEGKHSNIMEGSVRGTAIAQALTFLLGLIVTGCFGAITLFTATTAPATSPLPSAGSATAGPQMVAPTPTPPPPPQ